MEKGKWNEARDRLPDMRAVMTELDKHFSAMDAHAVFMFVENDPEGATVALTMMYEIMLGIAAGKTAMSMIPVRDES